MNVDSEHLVYFVIYTESRRIIVSVISAFNVYKDKIWIVEVCSLSSSTADSGQLYSL